MKNILLFLSCLLAATAARAQVNNARMLSTPNAQTGTSYTFVAADTTRVVTFNNASPVAVTLPSGATLGFGTGTMLSVLNLGGGTVTITCSSCTINGSATFTLLQGEGSDIYGGSGSPPVNYVAVTAGNTPPGTPTNSVQLNCSPGVFCGASGVISPDKKSLYIEGLEPWASAIANGATCNGSTDDSTSLNSTFSTVGATGDEIRLEDNCNWQTPSISAPTYWNTLHLRGRLSLGSTFNLYGLTQMSGSFPERAGVPFFSWSPTATLQSSSNPVINVVSCNTVNPVMENINLAGSGVGIQDTECPDLPLTNVWAESSSNSYQPLVATGGFGLRISKSGFAPGSGSTNPCIKLQDNATNSDFERYNILYDTFCNYQGIQWTSTGSATYGDCSTGLYSLFYLYENANGTGQNDALNLDSTYNCKRNIYMLGTYVADQNGACTLNTGSGTNAVDTVEIIEPIDGGCIKGSHQLTNFFAHTEAPIGIFFGSGFTGAWSGLILAQGNAYITNPIICNSLVTNHACTEQTSLVSKATTARTVYIPDSGGTVPLLGSTVADGDCAQWSGTIGVIVDAGQRCPQIQYSVPQVGTLGGLSSVLSSNVAQGDSIFAITGFCPVTACTSASQPTVSWSDTVNAYTGDVFFTGSTVNAVDIGRAFTVPTTTAPTVTTTLSSGSTFANALAFEVAGLGPTPILDSPTTATAGGPASYSVSSISTSASTHQANEMCIAAFWNNQSGLSAGAGWTLIEYVNFSMLVEYEQAPLGTVTATISGGASQAAAIACYIPNGNKDLSLYGNVNLSGASLSSGTNLPPYGAGGGTVGTQTVTTTPSFSSLTTGRIFSWLPVATNSATTSVTINPNSIGACNVTLANGAAINLGDLNSASPAIAEYDGTECVLQNPYTQSGPAAAPTSNAANPQAQTLTVSPALSAYYDDLPLIFNPGATNTGAGPTIAVSGLAAVTITKCENGTALVAGDLPATKARLLYNSATPNFDLLNPATGCPTSWHGNTAYSPSGNYTNATTSFTNVTGLSFAVAANSNYSVICNLDWQATATTLGLKFQWTGPASPTAITYDNYAVGAVATAFSTSLSTNNAANANTNTPLQITMTLLNGANAGTIQLQAAATATGTVTIIPSSCRMQQ